MEQNDDPHRPAPNAATSSSLWSNASASAGASIISRLCTHPLDTIKARIQVRQQQQHAPQHNYHTIVPNTAASSPRGWGPQFMRDIQQRGSFSQRLSHYLDGYGRRVRSLYRGLGVVIVGGTPGTMLYLCSYDIMKEQLSQVSSSLSSSPSSSSSSNKNHYNFLIHFVAGMMAEAIACIVYVPVDVIKERMQVQQPPPSPSLSSSPWTKIHSPIHTTHLVNHNHGNYYYYRNTYDAMRQILQTEGIRGIYRGYAATLASFGPFSALYFVFYEYFKDQVRASMQQQQEQTSELNRHATTVSSHKVEIPFHWTVTCAATAGGLASFITSPLDMAKLRLQVQRSGNRTGGGVTRQDYYTSLMDCLQKVYRREGVSGLFRGAGARVWHFAPATTVTMTMYDTLRPLLESS